jgi:hypothetical protein
LGATAPGAGAGGEVALASVADDDGEGTAIVGYPIAASSLVVDRTTVVVKSTLVDATAVDANLLAWRSTNIEDDEDSAVVDEFSAASDEVDAVDLAAVWQDDAWLKRLGVS